MTSLRTFSYRLTAASMKTLTGTIKGGNFDIFITESFRITSLILLARNVIYKTQMKNTNDLEDNSVYQ